MCVCVCVHLQEAMNIERNMTDVGWGSVDESVSVFMDVYAY